MKVTRLVLAAAIGLAGLGSAPALTIPCGIVAPCPTNFATITGLKAAPRIVVAGGSSVWALDNNYNIYRWNSVTKVFNQIPGQLVWISVGGGDLRQPDQVWGYNQNGQYWQWNYTLNNWTYIPTPSGGLGGLKIAKGYSNESCYPYEVWGLATPTKFLRNNIYRYNFCNSAWDLVPGQLASLSIANDDIWGINYSSQIFRLNIGVNTWTQIPGALTSLTVNSDGIWGLNASDQAFQFNPATQTFVLIPNITLIGIQAGGNGVWGLGTSDQVYRYQAVTRTFVLSTSVNLSWLSVGFGGDVWGIDTAQQIRAFVTPAISPGYVLSN